MHEPKASALSARDRYLIERPLLNCPSALTSPVMHCQLVSKVFSSLTDLRQPRFCWALFRKVCTNLVNAHLSVH